MDGDLVSVSVDIVTDYIWVDGAKESKWQITRNHKDTNRSVFFALHDLYFYVKETHIIMTGKAFNTEEASL